MSDLARTNFEEQSTRNNRGTVGNSVFYAVRAKGLYNGDTSGAGAGVYEEMT
jgi:hypothetical protein